MADIVKYNSGDNKAEVAYNMALSMWRVSKGNEPSIEGSKEFLDLLRKCVSALRT